MSDTKNNNQVREMTEGESVSDQFHAMRESYERMGAIQRKIMEAQNPRQAPDSEAQRAAEMGPEEAKKANEAVVARRGK